MKKLFIYTIAVCSLASCELERLPYSSYPSEKAKADIDLMLDGCYRQMKDASISFHYVGEYPSDNIMKQNATSDEFNIYMSYKHAPNNGRVSNLWNQCYKVISQSSDLIKSFPTGDNVRNQKVGEAFYLRGLCYFNLCRTFGRPYYDKPTTNLGVPIVNGLPENMENPVLPDRSTVEQTYKQIVSDLRLAEQLMTVEQYRSNIYASKYAAQAMLAKVYLYMSGTYENPDRTYADSARYFSTEVINSPQYQLLNRNDFMSYNKYTPEEQIQTETIFAVKRLDSDFTPDDYWYTIGSMYANINGIGWGEIYASAKYLKLLNEEGKGADARSAFIIPQYDLEDGKQIPCFRFVEEIGNGEGYNYVQGDIESTNSGYIVTIKDAKYPLTAIDAANDLYSIEYNGKTYIGEKDYWITLNNGYPEFYISKASYEDGIAQLHSPVISRLAEVYLIRAEAYVKLGDNEKARIDLNTVRERSVPGKGYTFAEFSMNPKGLVDKERQLELAFEGERAFDVFRIGDTMERRYPGFYNTIWEIPANDYRVVQYIPQSEINTYPNLTQNPSSN